MKDRGFLKIGFVEVKPFEDLDCLRDVRATENK